MEDRPRWMLPGSSKPYVVHHCLGSLCPSNYKISNICLRLAMDLGEAVCQERGTKDVCGIKTPARLPFQGERPCHAVILQEYIRPVVTVLQIPSGTNAAFDIVVAITDDTPPRSSPEDVFH
jgi:hypothetical protein